MDVNGCQEPLIFGCEDAVLHLRGVLGCSGVACFGLV
jgi:hypothetical protein